jgi:type IV secretory pathway VirB10-like protein
MNWILEHLQIVLLVVIGIASVLKSAFDNRKTAGRTIDAGDEDDSDRVPLDQDKSYRKGMPRGAAAPPPLPEVREAPRERKKVKAASAAPPPLSAAEEAARVLKHQEELAARLRRIREAKATNRGGAATARTRAAVKPEKQSSQLDLRDSLRKRLANPAEVRRAFVMREILDRPVGLR